MYEGMLRGRFARPASADHAARQGPASACIWCRGQGKPAVVIAAAHRPDPDDYCRSGAARTRARRLYRGLPLAHLPGRKIARATTTDLATCRPDAGRGRARASRHVIGSSSVAAQMPHATGLAWAARMRGRGGTVRGRLRGRRRQPARNDFQSGLNFAAVFKAPVVFVCQNNQWAISTPLSSQTAARKHCHQKAWLSACRRSGRR